MEGIHSVAKESFHSHSQVYERARPSYPSELLNFIFNDIIRSKYLKYEVNFDNIKILDLGAGTGIFTRLLIPYYNAKSHENEPIVAVEPVDGMREEFAKVLPSWVKVYSGTGNNIPFDDNSFDIVICAQAFHWFDNIESIREINRILKKNGLLFLTWNLEDNKIEWIKKFRETFEVFDEGVPQYRKGIWRKIFEEKECKQLFGNVNEKSFTWNTSCTIDILWEKILFISYLACLPIDIKEKLKGDLYQILLDQFGDSLSDPSFEIPLQYVNDLYWFHSLK